MPLALPKALVPDQPENINDLNENLAYLLAQIAALQDLVSGEGIPAGTFAFTGRSTAPVGWVLGQGQTVPRDGIYTELFAAIGTIGGAGDGSTTFVIPNAKGRTVAGRDAAIGDFATLGALIGAREITLSAAQSGVKSHGHSISDPGHDHGINVNNPLHEHTFIANDQVPHSETGISGVAVGAGGFNVPSTAGTSTWEHRDRTAPASAGVSADVLPGGTGISVVAHGGEDAAAAHSNVQPTLVLNGMFKL